MRSRFLLAILFPGMMAVPEITLSQGPPYPIIFIHGINSSHGMWEEDGGIVQQLQNFGWNDGGVIHVTLDRYVNHLGLLDAASKDVYMFENTVPPGDFYRINFDVDSQGLRFGAALDNVSSLRSSVSTSDFSLSVDDPDKFLVGDILRINDEFMRVESKSGNDIKVVRGIFGSNIPLLHGRFDSIFILSNQSNQASIEKQARGLKMAIDAVKAANQATKVILVGHSMGGLAARRYIQNVSRYQDDVYKLVTLDTPHLGSDKSDVPSFYFLEQNFGIDIRSDAVRDLRYKKMDHNGSIEPAEDYGDAPFLFGGPEGVLFPDFKFYNLDFNGDGAELQSIPGLNHEPWPASVEMTAIIGTAGGNDDGVVLAERQYFWRMENGQVRIFGDTLKTDRRHISVPVIWKGVATDYPTIIAGLDEPDTPANAVPIVADKFYHLFSTRQPKGKNIDVDWLYYTPLQSGAFKFEIFNAPSSNPAHPPKLSLYRKSDLNKPFLEINATPSQTYLQAAANVTTVDDIFIRLETERDDNSWKNPMVARWQSVGPGASLSLTSASSALPAQASAQTTLTAEIVDTQGKRNHTATDQVRFTIISGSASATLVGPNPVNAVNGVATITLQATTTPGLVTIEAQSPGLNSATTMVAVYANPTTISSPITTNTTWTLAKSPYLVTTDIEVNAGVTLSIEPGVNVLFRSEADITVSGTLNANGTATQHITFTSSSTTPTIRSWGGLRLNAPQGSLRSSFSYCDFSYGGQGGFGNYDDVFEMSGYAEPQISHCTIRSSRRNGIQIFSGAYNSNFRLNVTDLPLMVLEDLTVGQSARMTIDPGVRLKFASEADLYVDGALNAQGTSNNRIIFTSMRDDAVDGDTDGNGVTTGNVGDWGGIYFNSTIDDAQCKLSYCDFKFAGQGGYGNIDTPIRMDARANPSFQTLRFVNCRYNGIDIVAGDYATNISFNQTAAPYIIRGDLAVQKPGVLTIAPGALLKMTSGSDINIYGGLVCRGAAGNPIRFTSIRDDSRGGDTGNDGATVGNSGDWGGIFFDATVQGSSLNFCGFHYGGGGGYGNTGRPVLLDLRADATFANLLFDNCTSNGIALRNGEYRSDTRLRFPGKTPFLQFDDISIAAGAKLTIDPGCILKLDGGSDFYVNGGLKAEGTSTAPIIFTSLEDDSLFGDSDNNGHSLGLPGQWGGIAFSNSAIDSVCRMRHCQFRFGGGGGYGNVGWVVQVSPLVNPTFENLRFVRNNANGIRLAHGSYNSAILFDQTAAPYILSDDYFIEAAGSLTVAPGTLFKCYRDSDIFIKSRLTAVGTPAAPIIFTSYRDDRYRGDTNNDGVSNGVPGDWGGIVFQGQSGPGPSEIAYGEFWYGASGGSGNSYAILTCDNASPKVHHVQIRQTRGNGIYASGAASPDLGGGAFTGPGNNSFLDFSSGTDRYAVYNDGSATIFAKNNTWDGSTVTAIAKTIFDKTDNASKGQVIFDPFILPGDNEAPQVSVLFPNGGETLLRGQAVTLRWYVRDNVGVTKIDVALSRDGGQNFQPITSLTTSQDDYKWNAIGPFSSRCLLKVTGRDAAGNERFDVSDNFFAVVDSSSGVNYPPSIPRPLRPLAGEEMRGSDLLIWQASVDPNPFDEIRYRLEIDNNANFASPELVEENIDSSRTNSVSEKLKEVAFASTSMIAIRLDKLAGFVNLQDDVVYYWRVRARDQQNVASAYSDGTARFFMNKTNTPPQAVVTGFSPANNVEARAARPTISWQAADDPDPSDSADILRYLLQMDDDGEFVSDLEIAAPTNSGVTFYLPTQDLHENARYSYRVQASDDEGAISPWSAVQSFFANAIKEPPRTFAIRAPAPRFVAQNDTVIFQWDATTDPDPFDSVRYVVEWSTNQNFSSFSKLSYASKTTRIAFLRPGRVDSVFWRLYAIDADTLATYAGNSLQQPRVIRWQTTAVSARARDLPTTFSLAQNYPNPFNRSAERSRSSETTIAFALPKPEQVRLHIFNMRGQEVRLLLSAQILPGFHTVKWDGRDDHGMVAGSGVYFVRIQAGDFIQTMKILMLQ